MGILDRAATNLTRSRVWKSVFRDGVPDTNLDRATWVFNSLFLHIHPVKVRRSSIRFRTTYYLGGISFALFLLLIVTGIVLMLYYRPSVPEAYEDMKDLQFAVANGVFLRNFHRWAAHAMVGAVFAHMLVVFYRKAYEPPREFNWVIGVLLLVSTLLLSYTGYLLPWDQLAFWGVSVGTNMVRAVPVFGEHIRFLLLGGHEVGPNALLRFYVLHCVTIPFGAGLLMALHFWRIRKDGGLRLPDSKPQPEDSSQKHGVA